MNIKFVGNSKKSGDKQTRIEKGHRRIGEKAQETRLDAGIPDIVHLRHTAQFMNSECVLECREKPTSQVTSQSS